MNEKISEELAKYVLEQIENSMNWKQKEFENCEIRHQKIISYLWLSNHGGKELSQINLTDDQKFILREHFIEVIINVSKCR